MLRNPPLTIYQTLLRHEVVLYNCFTGGYDRLIKPAVPSAVSYQSIGCMVKPLPGEASGKQYQTVARVALPGQETVRNPVFGVSTPIKGLDKWAWLKYLNIP